MVATIDKETRTFIGANDVPLVADVMGDPNGPLVIFGHGGGQTRHSWGTATATLAEAGYHVVNYDARGHGNSGWAGDGGYTLDLRGRDLVAIIGDNQRPVGLVGASMGGATSLYTAARFPHIAVGAVILVDIVPNPDPEGVRHITEFMSRHVDGFDTLEQVADAVAAYNPARPRPTDISGLRKNVRERNGRLYWHWDPAIIAPRSDVEVEALADAIREPARPLDFPTLLVRGLKSDIVSDRGIADLKAAIPHVEIYDVPEAGHMVAGDKNDAFNEGVLSFLKMHMPL